MCWRTPSPRPARRAWSFWPPTPPTKALTDAARAITAHGLGAALNDAAGAPSLCKMGVSADGGGSIESSINVSSVIKNGTGDFTVNFATYAPNNLYRVHVNGGHDGSGPSSNSWGTAIVDKQSSYVRV